jgi:hypothetical protein
MLDTSLLARFTAVGQVPSPCLPLLFSAFADAQFVLAGHRLGRATGEIHDRTTAEAGSLTVDGLVPSVNNRAWQRSHHAVFPRRPRKAA